MNNYEHVKYVFHLFKHILDASVKKIIKSLIFHNECEIRFADATERNICAHMFLHEWYILTMLGYRF